MDAPITLERLEEELREGYHILHYLGHGAFNAKRQQAALYLQDADGHAKRVLDDEMVAWWRGRVCVRIWSSWPRARARRDRRRMRSWDLAPSWCRPACPPSWRCRTLSRSKRRASSAARSTKRLVGARPGRSGGQRSAQHAAHGRPARCGRAGAVHAAEIGAVVERGSRRARRSAGLQEPKIFWTGLIRMIQQGKCTPIIGPRVHGRWLPTRNEIAQRWAKEHDYPFARQG